MKTKRCSKCHRDQELRHFKRDNRKPDRHASVCKDCASRYMAGYWDRRRFAGQRADLIAEIGACVNCGMTQAEHHREYGKGLTVHHADGHGIHDARPNNAPENLELLCYACHGAMHGEENWPALVEANRQRRAEVAGRLGVFAPAF